MITPEERVILAMKMLTVIRDNIVRNKNVYNGAATPNIESVMQALGASDIGLLDALQTARLKYTFAQCSDVEIRELQNAWKS